MSKIEMAAFNPWLALMRPFFEGLPEQTFEKSTSLAVKWSEFLYQRLQEDAAFWGHLVGSKTPQDVQKVYVEFWTTAWSQYQDYFSAVTGTVLPKAEIVPSLRVPAKYKTAA